MKPQLVTRLTILLVLSGLMTAGCCASRYGYHSETSVQTYSAPTTIQPIPEGANPPSTPCPQESVPQAIPYAAPAVEGSSTPNNAPSTPNNVPPAPVDG